MTELSELPFHGLTNSELMKATGTWVFHSASLLTDSRDLFCSVIESPDKDDNLNMNTIESKYYNIKRTGVQFQKASSKGGIKSSSLPSSITTFVTPVMFIHIILDMLQKLTSIKHVSGLILEKRRSQH